GEDPWEVFISDEAGGNRDELVARCKEFNKEIFSPTYKAKAKLFPGVIKTLEALNNKGLKLGGITSGLDKHKIHEVFKREGASALLSEIVSRQDVASSKPAPDLLEECSQRLGVPSFESVCVGDTPLDIRMAKGAGAAAVGVLSGVGTREQLVREAPDAIVEDVSGLIPLLEAC
ncbi:TPA: HAD family hydrolase, partial [Candidatus Micrarchaeota archaeon]|nr:HAD family hydrolase [Candidatus Micrarchaeota archaeon]